MREGSQQDEQDYSVPSFPWRHKSWLFFLPFFPLDNFVGKGLRLTIIANTEDSGLDVPGIF